jgi:hypothetical protein
LTSLADCFARAEMQVGNSSAGFQEERAKAGSIPILTAVNDGRWCPCILAR